MIAKKISLVGLFTGISQFISLFAFSFIARHISSDQIGMIGSIESTFFLIITIISFGLQLNANRKIALTDNWADIIISFQRSRILMGLILFNLGFLYFLNKDFIWLLFFFAPIIALNIDYALYGTGSPIYASFLSFLRLFIPSAVIIISSVWYKEKIIILYIIAFVSGIFLISNLASRRLNIKTSQIPRPYDFKRYIDSIYIGLSSISLTITTTGLIAISVFFFI